MFSARRSPVPGSGHTDFPFPAKVWVNGNEWANGYAACDQPERLQEICDGFGPEAVQCFFDRWIGAIPVSLTSADRAAGYWWELSVRQVRPLAPWSSTTPAGPEGSSSPWWPTTSGAFRAPAPRCQYPICIERLGRRRVPIRRSTTATYRGLASAPPRVARCCGLGATTTVVRLSRRREGRSAPAWGCGRRSVRLQPRPLTYHGPERRIRPLEGGARWPGV